MPLPSFTIEDILRPNISVYRQQYHNTETTNMNHEQTVMPAGKTSSSPHDDHRSFIWNYISGKDPVGIPFIKTANHCSRLGVSPESSSQSVVFRQNLQTSTPEDNEEKVMLGIKRRRFRTVFTGAQITVLETRFSKQKYLSTPDRITLAKVLGLTQLQVKTWYQNRRMRWKKSLLSVGNCEEIGSALRRTKGRPKKDFDFEPNDNHYNCLSYKTD